MTKNEGNGKASKYIDADTAEQSILQTVETLLGTPDTTDTSQAAVYSLYAKKLVADVLDYCHRNDFPAALIYTHADLLVKRTDDASSETKGLRSVKMWTIRSSNSRLRRAQPKRRRLQTSGLSARSSTSTAR